ncbi:MAG: DUF6022 family protein [Pseudonocardiaceae bacterium]
MNLGERLGREGRSLATVVDWMITRLETDWRTSWDQQLPRLEKAFDTAGEPAYGIYNRGLFAPLQKALKEHDLTCDPALPGTLPLSEEKWGPDNFRERRMWTLLYNESGRPLGAIVTRFFHDHTELRLPAPPTVVGLRETDHDRIRSIVTTNPTRWPGIA